jgi:NAD(P)-dependent dehydrogenase (short-subunit alcohol dehydrogenase family)
MTSVASLFDIRSKAVLVTGASGHLGRVIATAMAELKADLVLVDRDAQTLTQFSGELAQKWGVKSTPVVVDLESEDSRRALVSDVLAVAPNLAVLINNAAFVGTSELRGWGVPLEQQSLETWRRAIEVNLTAVFDLCQGLAPVLRGNTGSIINIASIYGALGPDWRLYEGTALGNPAAYAASKGGLIQLSRWLATTLAPDVRVNTISPGGIARGQPERFTKKYLDRTPLKRMMREEDVIGAIAYLATPASAYVTGQNIFIDGGWSTW